MSRMFFGKNAFAPNSTAQYISDSHDHVLLYAKDKTKWKRKLLPRDEKHNLNYKNPDNDPRGPWTSGDMCARNSYSAGIYPITSPSGVKLRDHQKECTGVYLLRNLKWIAIAEYGGVKMAIMYPVSNVFI